MCRWVADARRRQRGRQHQRTRVRSVDNFGEYSSRRRRQSTERQSHRHSTQHQYDEHQTFWRCGVFEEMSVGIAASPFESQEIFLKSLVFLILRMESASFITENNRKWCKSTSLPSSTDFTSLKRFNKSLASEFLLPYCKVFLSGCSCCVWTVLYVFYFIFMCSLNDFYIYFMHINVSGRSVLLFNKLIDWLIDSLI